MSGGTSFGADSDDGPDVDDEATEEVPTDEATPTGDAAMRDPDPSLSGTFGLPAIPGAPTLEVASERIINGKLPYDQPIEFSVAGSLAEFVYDPEHRLFTSSLVEPVDCLVEEIAYQVLSRSSTNQQEWPISRITRQLREQYFRSTLVSYDDVRGTAESLLRDIVAHYQEVLPTESPLELGVLSGDEREALEREVVRIERAGVDRVEEIIRGGEFPRYLGPTFLPALVERWPSLLLDSRFLIAAYEEITPDLRDEIVRQVSSAIDDLLWIRDPGGISRGSVEWRSLLSRSASSVRLLEAWRS